MRGNLDGGYFYRLHVNMVTEDFKFVGRFQHWMLDGSETNYVSNLGLIYEVTSLVSFRVNIDVCTPSDGDKQAGIGALMQVYF